MKTPRSHSENASQIESEASQWAARIDRGLTAAEQDDYTQWLTANPLRRDAMGRYQWATEELDRLAGLQTSLHGRVDADLLAAGNPFVRRARARAILKGLLVALPIAAAASLAVLFFLNDSPTPNKPATSAVSTDFLARIEKRSLADGSEIEVNRGAIVQTRYSPEKRDVTLLQGEANFKVAKDASRPFVVHVAGVQVQAIGTEFNIRLSEGTFDILVTEGRVNIQRFDSAGIALAPEEFLDVGQKAVVPVDQKSAPFDISNLDATQIARHISWQPRLLDFDSAPLHEIVAAFNQSNPIKIVIGQPQLENVELSCSFWSDNTEGFVRLMESSFGMNIEWRNPKEIVLR